MDLVLALALTESYASKTPFTMRLAYKMKVGSLNTYEYIVDACTGRILSKDLLMSGNFNILYSPYLKAELVLAVAFGLSFLSYRIAMRRVTKEHARQKH